jgi:hypothetical protein
MRALVVVVALVLLALNPQWLTGALGALSPLGAVAFVSFATGVGVGGSLVYGLGRERQRQKHAWAVYKGHPR